MNLTSRQQKAFFLAAMAEGACILAGLAGYIMTDKLVWMAIGVVGGFGFSLPAIIDKMQIKE